MNNLHGLREPRARRRRRRKLPVALGNARAGRYFGPGDVEVAAHLGELISLLDEAGPAQHPAIYRRHESELLE
jgi:hypothetical protein